MIDYRLKLFLLLLTITILSCSPQLSDQKDNNPLNLTHVWFKQANVDLGAKILFLSDSSGFAISRGKGEDVPGRLYEFQKDRWVSIYDFPYSDFPIISNYQNSKLWFMIHQTHFGNYKPELLELSMGEFQIIELPKIMWDKTDFSMWTDMDVINPNSVWLVGQQGNILKYDGTKWNEEISPVKRQEKENFSSGDLLSISMVNDSLGFAVGKAGIIIQYSHGKWMQLESPTQVRLNSIEMFDNNFGICVGDRGTILIYDGNKWAHSETGLRYNLTSVKILDNKKAYAVGDKSTLLRFDGNSWQRDISITAHEDFFNDISVKQNGESSDDIWIIGYNGIYTNSRNFDFSFTNISAQINLQSNGRCGLLYNLNGEKLPNLGIITEEAPNYIYKNLGDCNFSTISLSEKLARSINSSAMAIADYDNDGYKDILDIVDDLNFNYAFGESDNEFRVVDAKSFIPLNYINYNSRQININSADFDNDGNLDIYINCSEGNDALLKNDGAGKFENIIEQSGIQKYEDNNSFGVSLSDFNNDNLIDILIIYRNMIENKNLFIFLNNGDFTFRQIETPFFYNTISPNTHSVISKDFNNDGNFDLFICNNQNIPQLFLNDGFANFREIPADSTGFDFPVQLLEPSNGIINAADVNNDGWIDIFMGNTIYLNSPQLKFQEAGRHIGLEFLGNPSFGDLDDDNDYDLYIGSSIRSLGEGKRSAIFRNNLEKNNFISVLISAIQSNRDGIGTRINLIEAGQDSLVQSRLLNLGDAPITQSNINKAIFGVVENKIYELEIIFPSGIVKKYENLKSGSRIIVNEKSMLGAVTDHALNSLKRSVLRFKYSLEIYKILIVMFVLLLTVKSIAKLKAYILLKDFRFITLTILIYIILIHITINQSAIQSIFYSTSGFIAFIGLSLFLAERRIQEKESKYISHYKLLEILGVGGMGKVFKAVDTNKKVTVALKVLNPTLLKDEENRKRLQSEGRLLSELSHENIVSVFEYGESKEHAFIAMEYLEGGTLEEYLQKNSPLSESEIVTICRQLLTGLEMIHEKGVIHRDLKTQNIMFDSNHNLKIMDFGLSKSPLVSTMTSLGTVVGTLGFVAPEQITNINIDERTDLFSFGVILYEMLTGKLPFSGENEMALIHSIFNTIPSEPIRLIPTISSKISKLCIKCLEKEPDKRYNSAMEILTELEDHD
ncbi:MAG: protein kinase [Melioribacteraceae bacterium]|nr:protein kinase [Melioribacteraceae bacterium]